MAETANEVGIPFVGHVPSDVGVDELRYMPPGVVQGWKQSHQRRRSAGSFSQSSADRTTAARIQLLGALHDAGARILMGTDAEIQNRLADLAASYE